MVNPLGLVVHISTAVYVPLSELDTMTNKHDMVHQQQSMLNQ
jgi:hypothetical protein